MDTVGIHIDGQLSMNTTVHCPSTSVYVDEAIECDTTVFGSAINISSNDGDSWLIEGSHQLDFCLSLLETVHCSHANHHI